MAIGSGLGGSLGMAVETTYGTYAAPTRWHPLDAFPFKKVPNYNQAGGLAAGKMLKRKSRRVLTHHAAEGQFTSEFYHKGMGRLINLLMGGTVAPVQQATSTAYLQTHTLQDPAGKFCTWQAGIPDTGGTVRPHTFLGCKVKSMEFSCETGGHLMVATEWDCRELSEAQALVAPSYTTGLKPFHFAQGVIKLGAVGSEASVSGVKKWSLKVERGLDTERFYFGNAGKKSEPLLNDWTKITGSVEVDYENKADFADRFHGSTGTSMVVDFTGDLIEATYNERATFKTPAIFFTGDTPTVDGPGIVGATFNFEVDDDETNTPLTIEIMSTDTTL
ncbi:phage tail tube protein [Streptomyces bullii]|uniref:Phage tail tube protein n=1 Tax=Streptomyces bullii TaxID=349910 RepID=A0ABW0USG6_9ACTN